MRTATWCLPAGGVARSRRPDARDRGDSWWASRTSTGSRKAHSPAPSPPRSPPGGSPRRADRPFRATPRLRRDRRRHPSQAGRGPGGGQRCAVETAQRGGQLADDNARCAARAPRASLRRTNTGQSAARAAPSLRRVSSSFSPKTWRRSEWPISAAAGSRLEGERGGDGAGECAFRLQ